MINRMIEFSCLKQPDYGFGAVIYRYNIDFVGDAANLLI